MKKVLTFILNHAKALLAVVVFGVTLIVVGVSMLNSYNAYKAYEKKYNENDLAVRSAASAAAQKVEINDSFSSKLAKFTDIGTSDMKTTPEQTPDEYIARFEGKIEVELILTETSFVDITFDLQVEEEVEDLFANVNFRVNDSLMEEEVTLPGGEFHTLALTGFALPEGNVTIQIEAKSGKLNAMPDVLRIGFYSNAEAQIVVQE